MQFDAHNGTAKFDLTLGLTETPDGLVGILEYNTDLFDRDDGRTDGRPFPPAARRSRSPMPNDRSPRCRCWPTTSRPNLLPSAKATRRGPTGRCVHHLFERHAAATPDAEAVVCGDDRITYGELNRRANRLAHHLRRRGVGPGRAGRHLRREVGRHGRRRAGDTQGRRRLRPARPGAAAGTARRRPGRLPAGGRADRSNDSPPICRSTPIAIVLLDAPARTVGSRLPTRIWTAASAPRTSPTSSTRPARPACPRAA